MNECARTGATRTTFAAREWLRLVSRMLATPVRAMSARVSSLGGTGSTHRLPSLWRTR